jgi:hypothetical protein
MKKISQIIAVAGAIFTCLCCSTYNAGHRVSTGPCDAVEIHVTINTGRIPGNLRDLVPFATKWGIGDQAARDEMKKIISADEYKLLGESLSGRTAAIGAWLENAALEGTWSGEACLYRNLLEFYNDVMDMQLLMKLKQ